MYYTIDKLWSIGTEVLKIYTEALLFFITHFTVVFITSCNNLKLMYTQNSWEQNKYYQVA